MKTLTNQLLSDLNTSYWEFLHQESFDKAFVKLQEKVAQNTVYGTFKETNEVPAFHEREIPISHITHLITNIRIVDNKIIGDISFLKDEHFIKAKKLAYLPVIRAFGGFKEYADISRAVEGYYDGQRLYIDEFCSWDYVKSDQHPYRTVNEMNDFKSFFQID